MRETDQDFRQRIKTAAGGEASNDLDTMTSAALDTEGARFGMARLEVSDDANQRQTQERGADGLTETARASKRTATVANPGKGALDPKRQAVDLQPGGRLSSAPGDLQERFQDEGDPILRPGETEEQRDTRIRAFHGRQADTAVGGIGQASALEASKRAEAQVEGLGAPGTSTDNSAMEAKTGPGNSIDEKRQAVIGDRESDTAYRTRLMAVARGEDGSSEYLNDVSGEELDQAGRDLGVERMNADGSSVDVSGNVVEATYGETETDDEYRRRLLPTVRRHLLAPFHDANAGDLDAIGAEYGIARGAAGQPRSPLAAQQGQDPSTSRQADPELHQDHPVAVLAEIRDFMARLELRLKHFA